MANGWRTIEMMQRLGQQAGDAVYNARRMQMEAEELRRRNEQQKMLREANQRASAAHPLQMEALRQGNLGGEAALVSQAPDLFGEGDIARQGRISRFRQQYDPATKQLTGRIDKRTGENYGRWVNPDEAPAAKRREVLSRPGGGTYEREPQLGFSSGTAPARQLGTDVAQGMVAGGLQAQMGAYGREKAGAEATRAVQMADPRRQLLGSIRADIDDQIALGRGLEPGTEEYDAWRAQLQPLLEQHRQLYQSIYGATPPPPAPTAPQAPREPEVAPEPPGVVGETAEDIGTLLRPGPAPRSKALSRLRERFTPGFLDWSEGPPDVGMLGGLPVGPLPLLKLLRDVYDLTREE